MDHHHNLLLEHSTIPKRNSVTPLFSKHSKEGIFITYFNFMANNYIFTKVSTLENEHCLFKLTT